MSQGSELVEFQVDEGLTVVGEHWRSADPVGTVLLLHGGGQTRHSWFKTAERLSMGRWNALNMDARGHGDSDWDPKGDYSIEALVGDVRKIIDWIGEPPVLVGASMGGSTSIMAEGEHQLARGLVLVDIVPRIEKKGVEKITSFMTAAPDGFATLEEATELVAAYNPHRKRPPTAEGLKKNLRLRENGRWYWHWDPKFLTLGDEPRREARIERVREAAEAIKVPTMLVRGKQSDIVSDEGVQDMMQLIPHARYADVGGAGHMVAGDDNDVFTEHLIEFLDEVAGTSTGA